jgi:DNA repair exonuclease SbcCD ATPase subunit
MNADEIKEQLALNAQEITRLHARIHETVRFRGHSPEQKNEWERACEEFHSRYDQLAFPGGYETAFDRILAGDEVAIETALCFLESRPYFFRSGYMWKEISRKLKHADLTDQQLARLKMVMDKYNAWRATKRAG